MFVFVAHDIIMDILLLYDNCTIRRATHVRGTATKRSRPCTGCPKTETHTFRARTTGTEKIRAAALYAHRSYTSASVPIAVYVVGSKAVLVDRQDTWTERIGRTTPRERLGTFAMRTVGPSTRASATASFTRPEHCRFIFISSKVSRLGFISNCALE